MTEERQELHEFQTKLDDAREKAAEDGIPAKELDALQEDIDVAAPQRVRALVTGKIELAPAKTGLEQDGAALDNLDIPSNARRTVNPAPTVP